MKIPSRRFLERLTWEEKARENPLYAVMSHEEFVGSGPEPTEDEFRRFYQRGQEMVGRWVLPWLAETTTTPEMRVLEFGCGMGRLVNALADAHPPENVFGVDISPTMVAHARRRVKSGVSFDLVDETGRLPYPDEFFDRVFSYAVFQHIARRSELVTAIREIARVLRPAGRARLSFDMVFPPPFENTLRQDIFALEEAYVVYGWTRRFSIPIWGIRINRANNWGGIRMGYGQLVRCLKECGIKVHGIEREPGTKSLVWFFGERASPSGNAR